MAHLIKTILNLKEIIEHNKNLALIPDQKNNMDNAQRTAAEVD